jgi:hypothetical protein
VCSDEPAACAIAARVETPAHLFPVHTAKDFTVARPMRKPVKLPGPTAAANKSISLSLVPVLFRPFATVSIKSVECEAEGSPDADHRVSLPRASATPPARVAVSIARISGDLSSAISLLS